MSMNSSTPARKHCAPALLKEAGTNRNLRVTLRADARATHQSVITAMDVLGRLGFAEINIATVKEEPAGRP